MARQCAEQQQQQQQQRLRQQFTRQAKYLEVTHLMICRKR